MPIPIFYRACQGHSTFAASIERILTDICGIYEWTFSLPEERLWALLCRRLRLVAFASGTQ
eukprot:7549489-Pyramimonas_sp.AAC.1